MRIMLIALVLLVGGVTVADAAPSFLGPSGNILTPDDRTLSQGQFSLGYHLFNDLDFTGDLDIAHGHFGLRDDIEVGISLVDPEDNGSDVSINGKWRFIDETAGSPGVAVGVIDVAGEAVDDDPSLYLLASKGFGLGENGMGLRGTVGVGTGLYDGLFAGAEWATTPNLSFMAEYLQGGDLLDDDDQINAGARFRVGGGLSLDAALVDFDDLAVGASYASRF